MDDRISPSTWCALAVGLALATAAGLARAQAAPADPAAAAPPDPAPAVTPPPPAVVEANPLAERQLEQVRKEIAAAPKLIEFHGYLRSGFGVNSKGGDQDAFQAPGAFSKYRLGNETEVYGDFELDSNWINPEHNDTWFKTAVKLSILAPRNSTFDILSAIGIREGYAEAGHVLASHPEMTFWAGQRYYRRRDVHIIDFFFNDMSGYGAGFQDLKVGDKTKLSIAYLGGSVELGVGEMPSDVGRFAKNTLDIRLSDIPVGPGNLELWLIPTIEVGGTLPDATSPGGIHGGIGGGVFYFTPLMGGFNEISAEFGIGGAANLSTSLDRTIAGNGWLSRLVDRATIQASPQLSMSWTGVIQLDNRNGAANGSGGNLWISAGARPVYCFTKYIGIAVEGGVDIVKAEASPGTTVDTGFVGKLTVAPMIRPGMDFWARPELRAYVTTAFWNNAVKGAVGGPAFANDNFGLTAGVQMESWW
ncbi:MAG TPA: carbohydrate porin [Kofleriaceae bacterium]